MPVEEPLAGPEGGARLRLPDALGGHEGFPERRRGLEVVRVRGRHHVGDVDPRVEERRRVVLRSHAIAEDGLQVGLGLVAESVLRPGVRGAERLLRFAGPRHAEARAEVALEPEALLLAVRDGREEDARRQRRDEGGCDRMPWGHREVPWRTLAC